MAKALTFRVMIDGDSAHRRFPVLLRPCAQTSPRSLLCGEIASGPSNVDVRDRNVHLERACGASSDGGQSCL